MGTRARYVVHINATSSFEMKMRMEKVGGNRKRVPTVSCLRHVCLSEEEMRSSREEVVIFRLKIRSKIANVVKGNGEKVKGGVKTLFFRVDTSRAVPPGDIFGSLP